MWCKFLSWFFPKRDVADEILKGLRQPQWTTQTTTLRGVIPLENPSDVFACACVLSGLSIFVDDGDGPVLRKLEDFSPDVVAKAKKALASRQGQSSERDRWESTRIP